MIAGLVVLFFGFALLEFTRYQLDCGFEGWRFGVRAASVIVVWLAWCAALVAAVIL